MARSSRSQPKASRRRSRRPCSTAIPPRPHRRTSPCRSRPGEPCWCLACSCCPPSPAMSIPSHHFHNTFQFHFHPRLEPRDRAHQIASKKVHRSFRCSNERAALCEQRPEFLTPTTNSEDGAGGRKQNLSLFVSRRLRVLNLGKQ